MLEKAIETVNNFGKLKELEHTSIVINVADATQDLKRLVNDIDMSENIKIINDYDSPELEL